MLIENRQFEPTPPLFGASVVVTPLKFRRVFWPHVHVWPIVWRCLRHPMFGGRFGTVPALTD